MIRGLFYFIFAVLICKAAFASNIDLLIENAHQKNLSESKEWKNLLHWRWNLLGGTESEADGKTFFFSKDGSEDLRAELDATLRAFTSEKKIENEDEHPACKFPARYLFFQRHLGIDSKIKKTKCPKYEKFHKRLSAKGISLVFSSYFISRPASAFGHTLMRFSKNENIKEGKKHELLDYAANYSANVTTGNAFLYGVMGLAGGFRGEFAAMPYFYKIREYSDYESRDLWDYHLNLNPQEINRVIAHLWEMSSTYFRYFYLTENCSYHMLGLLDVANPSWNLSERNPYFVVPADTISIIANTPNLLKEVTYRPSKMTQLKYRISLLKNEEKAAFERMTESLEPVSFEADVSSQAKVLDTAIDYIDFKFASEVLLENSKETKTKNKFLIARARLGIKTKTLEVPTPSDEMPHLGHKTRRIALGAGTSSKSDIFGKLEYRFAMHDLLDLRTGQNPNATMEMANIQLRYDLENKFRGNSSSVRVDEASIAKVVALTPIEKHFTDMSWRANIGARTIKDGGCQECFSPTAQAGFGLAIASGPVITYLMGATEFDFSKELGHRGYRMAVGPEARIIARMGKLLSWDVSGEWKKNLFIQKNKTSYSYASELRIHSFQNLNFGLKYKRYHKTWDAIAKIFYYF